MIDKFDWQSVLDQHLFSKKENPLYFINQYFLCKWFDSSQIDKNGNKWAIYEAVRGTGDFTGNFDYGRGLMSVTIRVVMGCPEEKRQVIIRIGNIDDGNWIASSQNFDTLNQANEFALTIKNAFEKQEKEKWGHTLVSEKQLNDFLMQFGFCGVTTD